MKKVFKYSLVALAILIVLWFAGLLVVYFVVDVETVKKSAISLVKENTNGELEINSIGMKLFPVVHFEAKGIRFLSSPEFKKQELLTCKSVDLNFNILSLLFGSPKLTLDLDNPVFNVIATKSTNNIVDVIKSGPAAAGEPDAKTQPAEKMEIPTYILVASLGFHINEAMVNFTSPDASVKISDLEVDVEVDPVSRKADIELSTPFSVKQASETLTGRINFIANLLLESKDKLLLKTNVKLDGLGLPLAVDLNGKTDFNSLDIHKLTVSLPDKWLEAKGRVSDLKDESPVVDLGIETVSPLDISELSAIAPAIKQNKVKGKLAVSASVKGKVLPLPYVKKLAVNITELSVGGGQKGDISLSLSNKANATNIISADIASGFLELVLPPPSSSSKSEKAKAVKASKSSDGTKASGSKQAGSEEDPVISREDINLIRSSIARYSLFLNADMKKVKMDNLFVNNIKANAALNRDSADVKKVYMELLGGKIDSSVRVALNPSNPAYSGKAKIDGLKISDAVNTFVPSLKDSASGDISCNLTFASSGFTAGQIQKRLTGNGGFSFKKFVYSAASMNKMISEQTDKVSFLKDRIKLSNDVGWETVSGVFNIKDEKINVEQLLAEDGAYTVKGKGVVGMDQYIDMYLDLYMPYGQFRYEPIKLAKEDRVMLPVHVVGPMLKPRLDFPLTMKYITQKTLEHEKSKLLKNVSPKLDSLAKQKKADVKKKKEEVKKKAKKEAKKATEKAGKELKNMLKKIKF
ncbi:MAG: AsmA family protein [Oligoflexia bacterium]|nr:AsmA family protein [Oligoflexia bacterium]